MVCLDDFIFETVKDYYDSGVLPVRARKLRENGLSVVQIAKQLSHTKDRIEKALAFREHAFTRNALVDYEGFEISQEDMKRYQQEL